VRHSNSDHRSHRQQIPYCLLLPGVQKKADCLGLVVFGIGGRSRIRNDLVIKVESSTVSTLLSTIDNPYRKHIIRRIPFAWRSPMRVAWIFFLSILLLQAPGELNCQQTSATVQRDPQAIAILTQALNAAGGVSAIAAVQDFTAAGNVTYSWAEPTPGTVTIRGRGLHEFRVDATLPDGMHSWIINSSEASQKNPDGSTSALPSQDTIKPANATFPLLELLTAVQDTSIDVTYEGLVTHDGQQLQAIAVQKFYSIGNDPAGTLGEITKAHIFIDPNTLTVQSIVDKAFRKDGGPGTFSHEMQFSNYQNVNGLLVPFSITESVAGQQTTTFQLSQIAFNTGLTDADFQ
jgi:hypothetical protein